VNLHHLGWWWRKLGPIAIFSLTLLKFLPFIGYSHVSILEIVFSDPNCSLHKETLHFWTVFSASFLEFLLFSSMYWWTLISSKHHRKWISGLAGSSILCSAVVLMTVISLVTGWKLPWIRSLLLEVMEKLISRLEESSNDKHRSCYCSSRYNFRYVAFTSRAPSPLKLSPRIVTRYRTKHQTSWCVSSMMLLGIEEHLHQHQGNH
jgi:hypothetical protein